MANTEGSSDSVGRHSPRWVKDNQTLGAAIGFFIISLYLAPVFIIAGVAWYTQGFQEENFWFVWFAAFIKSADSTLNLFHKLLLPIMSGLSVLAFRSSPTKGMLLLGAFILFGLTTTIFVSVVFEMDTTKIAITGLKESLDLNLAKAFFTRIQESLMMYLMLLLGIGVVNKK
ncbi:MAG: hypothetical protein Q8S00_26740 [Deltaproteobacteria bacterium]|nr:hypothetical protein [Deltaproteobacteria bacterium]MDZ4347389.1 hypothetical protein [Candidatus Binatia bacterium]